ncbi:MAG: dipeptide epimerase [Elusimicrobia bacterium]|nr:dipeptide epimerase [Elusimicrobiota bacterium]
MNEAAIVRVRAAPLNVPMTEPFEIATGVRTRVENVLVLVKLADGTHGFGECAPFSAVSKETQASALAAVRRGREHLIGKNASDFLSLARALEERIGPHGSARAGLEMAVLDARMRQLGIPLWRYFGGAGRRVRTDITVTLVTPSAARRAARRILARGVSTIKIKIGRDLDEDIERIRAVASEAPRAELLLDANEGYRARQALSLLRRLRALGIRPALLEQPVARHDWTGLAQVSREGGVPVAADESVSSLAEAWTLLRHRAAAVINIKLMKYGIAHALAIARLARASGLRLMIGGMVESTLAMGCAAHLAAGFGGFRFIDLDTPLWFARNPMRGLSIGPGGLYDLGPVRAGIGSFPRDSA